MGSFILNFSPDRLITAANIVDNVLYFTDNENEPKRINLEVFREADHSNGTTSVYGRQFLERDITVIRPHPQAVINSNLSSEIDVPIDATEPLVITGGAMVLNDFVKLNGSAIPAGTPFTKRGFYYYESATLPTLSTVIASGIEVESSINGGFAFSEEIVVGDNKKFYYVAYAKTQVGFTIYGELISFKSNALTTDFPTVETSGHEKITNLSYKLKGKVTDPGGSQVIETGFYYYYLDLLSGSAVPSTLVGDNGNPISSGYKKISASYDPVTGEFIANIHSEPLSIMYYQAYAINTDSGQDEGLVKSQILSGGEGPRIKLEECTMYRTKAIVRARVTVTNGTLSKRGFYLSKTSNNAFTMIAQHSTNSNIYKVEDSSLNVNNQTGTFEIDTSTVSGLTLQDGDTLYVMAFADNGIENQTGVLPLNIRDASLDPPSITTSGVQVVDNSGNSRLRCSGVNNSADYTGMSVQKLGFYITRTTSGVSLGSDQAAKTTEMIRRFNATPQTATEVISVNFGLNIIPDTNNTDPGNYIVSFDGDNVVPLEAGYDYHVMAVGFNGTALGHGNVATTPTKTDADAPPFYTKQVSDHGLTSGKFHGLVEEVTDPTLKQNLDDAGFTWAVTESGLKINHVSISSGDLTSLNSFITNGTGDGRFSVIKAGLANNDIYYVQAYVTPAGGSKVYATFDDDDTNNGDGIVKFKTLNPGPDLPKLRCFLGSTGRTTQKVYGSLTNDGGSNYSLFGLDPVFYYCKKSLVTGSTDNARKANIITLVGSNAKSADKGKISADYDFEEAAYSNGAGDEVFALLGGSQEYVLNDTSVPLTQNTDYYVFMVTTTSNGATASETYGGLGAGKAISNLASFKTDAATATAPAFGPVQVKSIGHDLAWASVYAITDGGNRDWQGIKHGFYYIKKSDLVSNYDPNNGLTAASTIVANANKAFVETRNPPGSGGYMGALKITDLDVDTEYYIIAAAENAAGIGYSGTATLFRTGGALIPDQINFHTPNSLTFNSQGAATGSYSYVEISVSPSASTVNYRSSFMFNSGVSVANSIFVNLRDQGNGKLRFYFSLPQNLSNRNRSAIFRFTHSSNFSISKEITINQTAGVYGGGDNFDDPFGDFYEDDFGDIAEDNDDGFGGGFNDKFDITL